MSDLMLANSTYASGTNDTASTITNNVTTTDAAQMNGVASACVQIETVLGSGTSLKGSVADLVTRLAVSLNADGSLVLDDYLFDPGDICASFRDGKTGWLLMDNSDRSNNTYTNLLDQIIGKLSTVSTDALKVGSPVGTPTANAGTDTFTLSSHGLVNNTIVYFTNSGGGLPGGISALTKYFIINTATNTFQVSTTLGGSVVDLTTNGTGTTSVYNTFKVDGRGMSPLGKDSMGGSSANKATDTAADNVGQSGGSETGCGTHSHTITDAGHAHGTNFGSNTSNGSTGAAGDLNGSSSTNSATTGITINNTGTGISTTGNMHPYFTVNYFIKT